jgi:hypothetical protein
VVKPLRSILKEGAVEVEARTRRDGAVINKVLTLVMELRRVTLRVQGFHRKGMGRELLVEPGSG